MFLGEEQKKVEVKEAFCHCPIHNMDFVCAEGCPMCR
jgi:hypothetical protein